MKTSRIVEAEQSPTAKMGLEVLPPGVYVGCRNVVGFPVSVTVGGEVWSFDRVWA